MSAPKKKLQDQASGVGEEKYREIIEKAHEGILVIQEYKRVYYNPRWLEIVGDKIEQYEKSKLFSHAHPEDIETVRETYEKLIAGEAFNPNLNFRLITRAGETKYVDVKLSRIEWEGQPATLTLVNEITEQKQAEIAQEASEKKFKSVFMESPVPKYIWQVVGDDLILQDYNAAAERITKKRVVDFVGMTAATMYRDDQKVLADFQECLHKKTTVDKLVDYEFKGTGERKHLNVKYTYIPPDIVMVQTEDFTKRIKAERLLEASERRYRTLVDTASDAIYLADENGHIVDVNQYACQVTGRTREELIGQPLDILDPHYPLDEFLAFWADKPFDEQFIFETTHLHKDGSPIPIEISGKKFKQGDKTYFYGIARDITERKQDQLALRESEERYIVLAENMNIGLVLHDADTKILFSNARASEILGLSIDEMRGKKATESIWDFTDEAGKRMAPEDYPVNKIISTKKPIYGDIIGIQKQDNDRITWVEVNGMPVFNDQGDIRYVSITFEDITERKLAEEQVVESQERFNLAMKASQDGLFDWNLETNEIYYSPGWKSMLGYEDAELSNDFSIWETNTEPEDVKRSWEMQSKLINKELDRFEIEFKMKHKDGHWVDILSRAEAVFDETGKAIRIVGTHVDISERKKAEIELEKHRHHLEELVEQRTQEVQQKMKEKNDLFELMVGREVRMGDLKDVIKKLRKQLADNGITPVVNDPMLRDDEEYYGD